ncbi:MAG: hypothetical protein J6C81_06655 [Muribaculaceae bacterium]|nr:hypothetical protein [Muribaculaceae bacterium]
MRKPSLDEFEDAIRKTGGNLSQTAGLLGVTRQTVHNWVREDGEFKSVVQDSRKKLFDQCLDAARIVALGVPLIDPATGHILGWKEKPDGQMLRYLLSTLGRDEGFGESVNVNLENPLPTVINIVRDPDAKRE